MCVSIQFNVLLYHWHSQDPRVEGALEVWEGSPLFIVDGVLGWECTPP